MKEHLLRNIEFYLEGCDIILLGKIAAHLKIKTHDIDTTSKDDFVAAVIEHTIDIARKIDDLEYGLHEVANCSMLAMVKSVSLNNH